MPFEIDITPYLAVIPFLKMKLPQTYVVAGRVIDVDAFIDKITTDGKISADDLPVAAAIWFGSPVVVHQPPVVVPPPPVVVSPPVVAPPDPPRPPVAGERVFPDACELKIHTILDRARSGVPTAAIPFSVDDKGQITRTDGVESFDEGTTIWFDFGASADGKGLRIDKDPRNTPPGEVNHPEFLGKQIYTARDVEGNLLAKIGGQGLEGNMGHFENGASFVPKRYFESGGMAANLRLKTRQEAVVIAASLEGEDTNTFRTPAIR